MCPIRPPCCSCHLTPRPSPPPPPTAAAAVLHPVVRLVAARLEALHAHRRSRVGLARAAAVGDGARGPYVAALRAALPRLQRCDKVSVAGVATGSAQQRLCVLLWEGWRRGKVQCVGPQGARRTWRAAGEPAAPRPLPLPSKGWSKNFNAAAQRPAAPAASRAPRAAIKRRCGPHPAHPHACQGVRNPPCVRGGLHAALGGMRDERDRQRRKWASLQGRGEPRPRRTRTETTTGACCNSTERSLSATDVGTHFTHLIIITRLSRPHALRGQLRNDLPRLGGR
jgi:hypothetical protein